MAKKSMGPVEPEFISGQMSFCLPAWAVMTLVYLAIHLFCHIAIVTKAPKGSSLAQDPHLAAHFVPQLFGFFLLAYYGAGGWLFEMPEADPGVNHYIMPGERIAMHMLSFQIYELIAAIPSPRLRGKHYEMIGHHLITVLLSVLAYKYQAFHYWAPCFMGMSEISSIPLAVMDFFKHFKPISSQFPLTNELTRALFACLFLPIRGVYWPYSSIAFWKSSLAALASPAIATPTFTPVIYTFCVCNILMTALQWYWASLILSGLYALVTGGKAPDADEGEGVKEKDT